ncbi:hypothetical protein ABG067_003594 [Albugo candida]
MFSYNFLTIIFGILSLGDAKVAIEGHNTANGIDVGSVRYIDGSCPKGNFATKTYFRECEGGSRAIDCDSRRSAILQNILIYFFRKPESIPPSIEAVASSNIFQITEAASKMFKGWPKDQDEKSMKKYFDQVYSIMIAKVYMSKDFDTVFNRVKKVTHPNFLYELSRFILYGCTTKKV